MMPRDTGSYERAWFEYWPKWTMRGYRATNDYSKDIHAYSACWPLDKMPSPRQLAISMNRILWAVVTGVEPEQIPWHKEEAMPSAHRPKLPAKSMRGPLSGKRLIVRKPWEFTLWTSDAGKPFFSVYGRFGVEEVTR
jgi:hypothetical protein